MSNTMNFPFNINFTNSLDSAIRKQLIRRDGKNRFEAGLALLSLGVMAACGGGDGGGGSASTFNPQLSGSPTNGADLLRSPVTGGMLNGMGGNDIILGMSATAAVTVNAGGGNDALVGGSANDMLTGGAGADAFILSGGSDTARDFNHNQGDMVDFLRHGDGTTDLADLAFDNTGGIGIAHASGTLTLSDNAAVSALVSAIDARGESGFDAKAEAYFESAAGARIIRTANFIPYSTVNPTTSGNGDILDFASGLPTGQHVLIDLNNSIYYFALNQFSFSGFEGVRGGDYGNEFTFDPDNGYFLFGGMDFDEAIITGDSGQRLLFGSFGDAIQIGRSLLRDFEKISFDGNGANQITAFSTPDNIMIDAGGGLDSLTLFSHSNAVDTFTINVEATRSGIGSKNFTSSGITIRSFETVTIDDSNNMTATPNDALVVDFGEITNPNPRVTFAEVSIRVDSDGNIRSAESYNDVTSSSNQIIYRDIDDFVEFRGLTSGASGLTTRSYINLQGFSDGTPDDGTFTFALNGSGTSTVNLGTDTINFINFNAVRGTTGNDAITGSSGTDTFIASAGADRILDFTAGSGNDKLDFSNYSGITAIGNLTFAANSTDAKDLDITFTDSGATHTITLDEVLDGTTLAAYTATIDIDF